MKILWLIIEWFIDTFFSPKHVDLIPSLPTSIPAAALDVVAEAAALGLTIEQYKLSPQYQAALAEQKRRADIDEIRKTEQAAEAGDPDALRKMRENVS